MKRKEIYTFFLNKANDQHLTLNRAKGEGREGSQGHDELSKLSLNED